MDLEVNQAHQVRVRCNSRNNWLDVGFVRGYEHNAVEVRNFHHGGYAVLVRFTKEDVRLMLFPDKQWFTEWRQDQSTTVSVVDLNDEQEEPCQEMVVEQEQDFTNWSLR